jgi:ankyrin repeat protein
MRNELSKAIYSGNLEEVKKLITEEVDYSHLLRIACIYGQVEIVKFSISHGADVHDNDEQAIKITCSSGRLEVLKILLDNGANIYAEDSEALKLAKLYGKTEVVEYLNKWMMLEKLEAL